MKTVVLHNVYMNNFSEEDEKYLRDGRVTFAITTSMGHPYNLPIRNTIFLMWDDRKYCEENETWDENLSPSPIDRVCDFVKDIWVGPKEEIDHLCGVIHQMRMGDTIHYDVEGFTFDVRNLDRYNK